MNILLGNRICPLTFKVSIIPLGAFRITCRVLLFSTHPIVGSYSSSHYSWYHFLSFFIMYYLFVCAGSLSWLAGLAAVCEISLLQPGIWPGPPSLGVWCLIHWTTREVSWPYLLMVFLLCFIPLHPFLSAPRTHKTWLCMSIICLRPLRMLLSV